MKLLSMNVRGVAAAGLLALGAAAPGVATAAVSVSWTSPPNHEVFPVGTHVTPQGLASASGFTGTGVDFSIVMDSSGSMSNSQTATDGNGNTVTKSRGAWQKEGALSLVAGLPDTATVSIIEFDSNANILIGQTLLDASGRAAVAAEINSVDESGGTNIPAGINASTTELTTNAAPPGDPTPGFNQAMVVFSDGSTSGNVVTATQAAVAAGVETVDSVALPGAIISTMQSIADNGNGTFIDATNDIGLVNNLLSGIGGLPIGLASLEVTDPDGNTTAVSTGVGGIFQAPTYNIGLGANIWTVTGVDTEGNVATATLKVVGEAAVIPLPASSLLMLSAIAGGIGVSRLRRRA